jgi:phage tail-like protein
MARASDPFAVFKFAVEIQDLRVGGFSEVSGLQSETEVEEYREGGNNLHFHKLAKATKYGNLILKRGLVDSQALWQWRQDVINGTINRKQVTVILHDRQGQEKWRWVFEGAYPVKWSSADLNATSSTTIAVESVELAHHGFTKGG